MPIGYRAAAVSGNILLISFYIQYSIFNIQIIDSDRVEGEKKDPTDELSELEASRVKEAALDDKLGIELKSIVEQIQV